MACEIHITSGVLVSDSFYLKPKCPCCEPKLCQLSNMDQFYIKNSISNQIPSGYPCYLTTKCVGCLPLLNNSLQQFTTDNLIYQKEYQVLPTCISGILFGQIAN